MLESSTHSQRMFPLAPLPLNKGLVVSLAPAALLQGGHQLSASCACVSMFCTGLCCVTHALLRHTALKLSLDKELQQVCRLAGWLTLYLCRGSTPLRLQPPSGADAELTQTLGHQQPVTTDHVKVWGKNRQVIALALQLSQNVTHRYFKWHHVRR